MNVLTGKKEDIFSRLGWLQLSAVILAVMVFVVQPVLAVAPNQDTTDFTAFYMGSDTADSCLNFNPFTLSDEPVAVSKATSAATRRVAVRTVAAARPAVIKRAPVAVPTQKPVSVIRPKPTVTLSPAVTTAPVVTPRAIEVKSATSGIVSSVTKVVKQYTPAPRLSAVAAPAAQPVVSVSYNPAVVEVVKPATVASPVATVASPAVRTVPARVTTRVSTPSAKPVISAAATSQPVVPAVRRSPVISIPTVRASNVGTAGTGGSSGRRVASLSGSGRRPAVRIPYRPPLRSPYQLPPRP